MVLKKEQRKNKKVNVKKWIKFLLIPFFLFFLWLGLTLINIYTNAGITVLTYQHEKEETSVWKTQELLADEKATGEFIARDDNLGIVAVRFNTFFRINEDIVRFRIKEKGSNSWYYENDYTTPQFQPNKFFTFGLPIISDSEGKIYQFEIESLRGEPENAVALSTIEPVYVTKYQYSKELITSDRNYALTFIYKKAHNSFTNPDIFLASLAYTLPFLIYITWLFFFDKYLSDKYYLVLLPIILMAILIIVDATRNDPVVLGLTLLWAFMTYVYHLKSTLSLFCALVLIGISPLLLTVNLDELSRNVTMWGYLLLVVGVLQSIWELKHTNRKLVGLTEFAHKIGIRKNP